ncbi:nucleotidyltransferase [candidate division KSB1 bacterium]|nr:nucleotidyltransferase [candidate division KSB1 bacterium]RQW10160.1 MAG: hypothetical protein EH222_02985 [candidate division KSB1 bacterium]
MAKNQFEKYIEILRKLFEERVDYILIGGVAIILYGFERPTRDIDLFVKLAPENIAKLRAVLFDLFKDESIEEITFQELEDYSVIRYGTPDGFYIDIIANIGEAFHFEDLQYDVLEFEDFNIKIATPETLLKLKKDTLRDKDQIDVHFLRDLISRNER